MSALTSMIARFNQQFLGDPLADIRLSTSHEEVELKIGEVVNAYAITYASLLQWRDAVAAESHLSQWPALGTAVERMAWMPLEEMRNYPARLRKSVDVWKERIERAEGGGVPTWKLVLSIDPVRADRVRELLEDARLGRKPRPPRPRRSQ